MEENKNKTFEAEIVSNEEEYLMNQCKKVKLASFMCIFFGTYGVDKFIMGCKKTAFDVLIFEIGLSIVVGFTIIFLFIPFFRYIAIVLLILEGFVYLLRKIYYIVMGIKFLTQDPKDVALKYEIYKQKERGR